MLLTSNQTISQTCIKSNKNCEIQLNLCIMSLLVTYLWLIFHKWQRFFFRISLQQQLVLTLGVPKIRFLRILIKCNINLGILTWMVQVIFLHHFCFCILYICDHFYTFIIITSMFYFITSIHWDIKEHGTKLHFKKCQWH